MANVTKKQPSRTKPKCLRCENLVDALSQLLDRLDRHGSIDLVREEGPIEDARTAIAGAKVRKGQRKPCRTVS